MQSMFSLHFGRIITGLIGDVPLDELSQRTHTPVVTVSEMAEGWIPDDDGVTGHFAACLGQGADRYVRLARFLKGIYRFRATDILTKQGLEELEEWESREVQRILAD